MSAHTPGPWAIEQDNGVARWWARGGGHFIGSIGNGTQGKDSLLRAEANARLVHAAPEMLAALVLAREFISTDRNSLADCSISPDDSMEPDDQAALDDYDAALLQIDAAIHKATGRAA